MKFLITGPARHLLRDNLTPSGLGRVGTINLFVHGPKDRDGFHTERVRQMHKSSVVAEKELAVKQRGAYALKRFSGELEAPVFYFSRYRTQKRGLVRVT